MEPPDSLEADGVNDLSVVATVDESVTTTQTVSVSFGTHRERSSNSNTATVHEKCLSERTPHRGSRLDQVGGCPHNLSSS